MYAFAAVAIWSGFIIVSRIGGKSDLTAYDVIAIRYLTSALIMLPFLGSGLKSRKSFQLDKLPLVLSGGLVYALTVFSAFKMSPATHASILLPGFIPFAVTLLAWVFFKEKLARNQMIGLGFLFAGVVCLGHDLLQNSPQTRLGDGLFIVGATSWAIYTLLLKRYGLQPVEIILALTFSTLALYLPVYFLWLPKNILTASGHDIALQAIYQGVLANVVQMFLYIKAVHYLGASRVGMLMAFVPVLSGLAAVPLLHEALTASVALGLALVSVGVFFSQKRYTRSPPEQRNFLALKIHKPLGEED